MEKIFVTTLLLENWFCHIDLNLHGQLLMIYNIHGKRAQGNIENM